MFGLLKSAISEAHRIDVSLRLFLFSNIYTIILCEAAYVLLLSRVLAIIPFIVHQFLPCINSNVFQPIYLYRDWFAQTPPSLSCIYHSVKGN
jgi:hypothetical protein